MTLEQWALLPVVLHFFMTAAIAVIMGRKRFVAVRSGRTKRADILNNNNNWPDDVLKFSRNFDNQFQLPMLWYAVTAFALVVRLLDPVFVILSWVFFGSRVLHSYIHTGSNTLPMRFYVFLAGFMVLIAMWMWFALRVFVTG
jgi:hypothetical protein